MFCLAPAPSALLALGLGFCFLQGMGHPGRLGLAGLEGAGF